MTPWTNDLAGDFTVADGLIDVTLSTPGGVRSVGGVLAGAVEQRALERLSQDLGVERTLRGFSLPVVELAGLEPGPGDRLDDGTTVWLVIEARLLTCGTRWLVHAQRGV